jgi:hypothetical protein
MKKVFLAMMMCFNFQTQAESSGLAEVGLMTGGVAAIIKGVAMSDDSIDGADSYRRQALFNALSRPHRLSSEMLEQLRGHRVLLNQISRTGEAIEVVYLLDTTEDLENFDRLRVAQLRTSEMSIDSVNSIRTPNQIMRARSGARFILFGSAAALTAIMDRQVSEALRRRAERQDQIEFEDVDVSN